MDRRERFTSLNDMLIAAMNGWQSEIWTALPGIVNSFDAVNQTCSIQLSVQVQITNPNNGNRSWVTLPLLEDCPVVFPSGGGCTLTFPLVSGDECLVVFSSRCIDAWWAYGGVNNQPMLRMHDLSDGFVIPGPRSQPRKFTVSTSSVQLRTNDGNAHIELNPSNHNVGVVTSGNISASGVNVTATASGTANITATTSATITSPTINLLGNVVVTGTLSATGAVSSSTSVADPSGSLSAIRSAYNSHTHSDPQGGSTGTPTPTM